MVLKEQEVFIGLGVEVKDMEIRVKEKEWALEFIAKETGVFGTCRLSNNEEV